MCFDHVGAGESDPRAFSPARHQDLRGYAADVLAIVDALELRRAVFVGHSVSAMIGVLAAIRRPDLFSSLVLIGPSPCYLNDGSYQGGFDHSTLVGLLDLMDSNYLGWSSSVAPMIMGNDDRAELGKGLAESFCRYHPDIARSFARVTFLSDLRQELWKLRTPATILQCSSDAIAPEAVGQYLHRSLRQSRYVQLAATGHCPHISHPAEIVAEIRNHLRDSSETFHEAA